MREQQRLRDFLRNGRSEIRSVRGSVQALTDVRWRGMAANVTRFNNSIYLYDIYK